MRELIVDNFAEEWRPTYIYPNQYEVSNKGNVRNIYTKQVLKPQMHRKGYCVVRLSLKDKKKSAKVHRLVAIAFIDNPKKLPQVNHIDGNKLNNTVANLEWCTNYDNMQHAILHNLTNHVENAGRKNTPVCKIDLETNAIIKTYSSIAEAAKENSICNPNILKVCKHQRQSAGGYKWEYLKEVMPNEQG